MEEKLGQLDETRAAERNLATLERHREEIKQLERDTDSLLESYAGMAPTLWTASVQKSAAKSTRC